jgi:hypothetical protein
VSAPAARPGRWQLTRHLLDGLDPEDALPRRIDGFSRFRNSQVAADFSSKKPVYLSMPGNCGTTIL